MSKISESLPPDNAVRDQILSDLDTSLLVEASAGTGKTTSMVGRMVALVRKGRAEVSQLAAVTFTRKSAAELRTRFQSTIERAATSAAGEEKARLVAALRSLETCYIGTIHGFCARLLRERPVEAGVDPSFKILEQEVDEALCEEAWRQHVANLYANHDSVLDELARLGLEPGELRAGFTGIANFPEVQWPADAVETLEDPTLAERIQRRVSEVKSSLQKLPDAPGNDPILDGMHELAQLANRTRGSSPLELFTILSACRSISGKKPFTNKNWPGAKLADQRQAAELELDRWNAFAAEVAEPYVKNWYAQRYHVALRVLKPGLEVHARLRRQAGGVNNQDLLLKTAGLLRSQAAIRVYFQRRITHLLVDEFQDTDPVQAEIMLLLTAQNVEESNWVRCRPRPGSLFVVGDPKQSIYRFRRADITTYQTVKQLLTAAGGKALQLTANFRSQPAIIDWVNEVFQRQLGDHSTAYQPAYSPIQAGKQQESKPDDGLFRLDTVCLSRKESPVTEADANVIARTIRGAIDRGTSAGEILLLTRKKSHLSVYARALQHWRIPVRITGGVFKSVDELRVLSTVLRAVTDLHDPVALVAALRSAAFGITDATLYAWHEAGHEFSIFARGPDSQQGPLADLQAALLKLQSHASWLRRMPVVAAFRRIAADLGLLVRAACEPGGNVQAGTLLRAFEVLRAAGTSLSSTSDMVDQLERLLDGETEVESTAALPDPKPGVRLMNLHKAKGLEAPIVFLADPTGVPTSPRQPELHIDRSEGESGYLCIREAKEEGSYGARVVAQPLSWDSQEDEESKFLRAEETRLLYVAATRAGRQLVISFKDKNPGSNPWSAFEPDTQSFQPLPVPAPLITSPATASSSSTSLLKVEAETLAQAAAQRWQKTRQASYRTGTASSLIAGAIPAPEQLQPDPERGASWGAVIHALLEAAMRTPGKKLLGLARDLLLEKDLAVDLAEDAILVVESVARSLIWKRALGAKRRLMEVPFECLLENKSPAADALPLLVRGVIDLVFEETNGWVIVDYKTDAAAMHSPESLLEHYSGQLEAYRLAWTRITGQQVHEVGIYFTRTESYCSVPIQSHRASKP